jgi:peroxiredoxin
MAVLAAAGAAALVRHTTAARRVATAADPYRALLDLPAEDGRRWSPAELNGREVLLCFFCGCPQCHALARRFAELAPQWPGSQVLLIAYMDGAAISSFRVKTGLTAPVLLDPFRTAWKAYAVSHCPECIVLDEGGSVAYRGAGGQRGLRVAAEVHARLVVR